MVAILNTILLGLAFNTFSALAQAPSNGTIGSSNGTANGTSNGTTVTTGPSHGFIVLGRAAPYGIIAGEDITNTGSTVINGNLGTPGNTVIGFTAFAKPGDPTGAVTGSTNVDNQAARDSFKDFQSAIAYGQKLAPTVDKKDKANVDAEVLTAGIYNYDGAVGLSNFLTFDAANDESSVWVIKIAEALTTTAATQIKLVNGAKSSNIFWVIGTSATLGANSVFQGSILTAASITVGDGVVVHGGLYASASLTLARVSVTVNATKAASPRSRARRSFTFRG